MVMSMTGYGTNTFYVGETGITVEIRSVNSRYLDFVPKMPRSFHEFELEIKKMIQSHFHRGRIEVYITVTGQALTDKAIVVDWDLMDHYIKTLTEMKEKYHLNDKLSFETMLAQEDILTIVENNKKLGAMEEHLFTSISKVIEQVLANRQSEGTFLENDINERIITIKNMLLLIEERQNIMYHQYRDRIKQRIEDHIGNKVEIDQVQLLQEIAILAEKGDIAEEITRLSSHLEHFDLTIEKKEPVGRKLDFILQEMHREINTIGSKSVDTKISEFVVFIKSEIEKIKEQVQNVE